VQDVRADGDRIEVLLGEERHVHFQTPEYRQIELYAGEAHSGIELFGWQRNEAPRAAPPAAPEPVRPIVLVRDGPPVEFVLGESHYRRSEESWLEAGCPQAHITLSAAGGELRVHVQAGASPFKHGPRSNENPWDNEHVDINYPGAQLYVLTPGNGGAWLIRPKAGERGAYTRRLPGWGDVDLALSTGDLGAFRYDLHAHIALPPDAAQAEYPVALDVLVNDAPTGRERRRGQLVLSGARGEFVYLRGDRHDPGRLLHILITDAGSALARA
jgi:hypothetical protein